ncbi:Uncharacterised protein [Salmonella enterica subsp. enterica serovar Bovismorbificans]|uniref:Uncharacterized protein n=1 Tax=Salmonella enterica subsp. enterica serovar Bovismorbificans TaxID=58097 RepID=A0A655E8Z6_SALET|nr:Uncharacterised protein [Salmonella enterica subsp. enterica serovar Bovismorbificans]
MHVIRRNKLFAVAQPGAIWSGGRLSGRRLSVHQTQDVIQSFRLREDLLQLLTVETVFTDHFINELLRIRVVGEVAAHLHDVMLRLKQKAAGRRARRRLSLGRFWRAATGSKQYAKWK